MQTGNLVCIEYATKHAIQVTLIDTAGRMNNSKPLMNELIKVVRVTKPDMKIFICDALTGNDAIDQAKKFYNHTEFDGVIMTKMDVDTKGGSAISISFITSKPILYVGTEQGYLWFPKTCVLIVISIANEIHSMTCCCHF